MLKRLILIVALPLVLLACSKDDKQSTEKPKAAPASPKAPAPAADDTTPTPVAHWSTGKSADKGGVAADKDPAAPDKAADPGKKPAGDSADKVKVADPAKASDCVAKCVQANQMRAVGADQIENDCKAECAKTEKCVTDCVKRNQMKAVAPEQIEADCKKDCAKP